MKKIIFLWVGVLSFSAILAQGDFDQEYVSVTNERAKKIVDEMELSDFEKELTIRNIISKQYRNLRRIQDGRERKIKKIRNNDKLSEKIKSEKIAKLRAVADEEILKLHENYIEDLGRKLTPKQIEAVKDGMTYGIAPKTYSNYLDMLPQLTEEQKEFIYNNLVEAREYAMDAGSSDKKHWWFNQYKGKITNYLAGEGYDLKKAEKQWLKNRMSYQKLATNILTNMRLSEGDKTSRLIEATVLYLNDLKGILDQRALTLKEIDNKYSNGSQEKDSLVVKAYEVSRDKYLPLKEIYVNKLEDNLTAYQVDHVKNGLTRNLFPNFYSMYMEMFPMLKPSEKAHIRVLLIEARENAMLAISREGQTQWWDKYRGIINNYIASWGYDFGKLSEKWDKANQDKSWAH